MDLSLCIRIPEIREKITYVSQVLKIHIAIADNTVPVGEYEAEAPHTRSVLYYQMESILRL